MLICCRLRRLKYRILFNAKTAINMRFSEVHKLSLHCTLAAAQCIVIGPVCLFVGVCVCDHDNSKLRSSIITKLGV